eukprot:TRINITY_DN52161_c0_g1_i1.p1 TRINITY_DN52161_c0_g1~~TRINITY_DN52161_c0_g1_i1.p1  ORF type:complete len:100 (+),score=8.03 TRINITY_DN52161_c0_g1_i1:86-385(+)
MPCQIFSTCDASKLVVTTAIPAQVCRIPSCSLAVIVCTRETNESLLFTAAMLISWSSKFPLALTDLSILTAHSRYLEYLSAAQQVSSIWMLCALETRRH